MRFAIFTTMPGTDSEDTPVKLLDNLREQVILAEELGFESVWLGEHHFRPYGLGDMPNPIVVGADLAARTTRIRIGQMSNIAPWWHPIRLAEDLAILDNLSKGRVDVALGRGIYPYEGPQFHQNADPRNEQENRELFEETIEIIKKVWTQEYFSHEGPNYTFPAPETVFSNPRYASNPEWQDGDRITRLRVTPKPYQKPHPPLWMSVSTDRSVSTAAELGLKACHWQPPPLRLRERFQRYAEIRSQVEGRPFIMGEDQAVLRLTYVTSTMEDARREVESSVLSSFTYQQSLRGMQVFLNPGEEPGPDTRIDWDFLERRNLLMGPPEHIAERIHELQELGGLDYLLMGHAHGRLSQKSILRNLELFGTKVMHMFQDKVDSAAGKGT